MTQLRACREDERGIAQDVSQDAEWIAIDRESCSRSFRRDLLPGRGEVLFAAMQGYFTLGAPWIPSDEGLAPVSTHQLNNYGVAQHVLIVSAIGAARRRFMNAMGLRALRQSEGDSARKHDAGRAVMAYPDGVPRGSGAPLTHKELIALGTESDFHAARSSRAS